MERDALHTRINTNRRLRKRLRRLQHRNIADVLSRGSSALKRMSFQRLSVIRRLPAES